MEKRIELEMRGKKADQIKELSLDNCRSSSILGLDDDFVNLKSLSLSNVGLTSLKGFPKLPNLKKLELSDNRISSGLSILVSNSPNLVCLNLSGNKIENLAAIEPLKDLKKLEALELCACEISNLESYKDKVFAALPSLKFLDGYDKDEKEAYSSDEENDKHNKLNAESSDLDEEEEEADIDEEDDDEDGDEDEGDGKFNLSYLEKENIDEDSEGEDYSPEEADDDEVEDEDDDDEDDATTPRGQKRKLDDTQD